MKTPLLYLVFNRPDLVKESFARIRKVRPEHLFIAADGPRLSVAEDIEKCERVKSFITQNLDWHCNVKYLYREENLGCGIAVSNAISWFFNHVEYGIILEDDCIANESFFFFCEELLQKYQNDKRVYQISGTNLTGYSDSFSFYFSRFPNIWGWATWRDRWEEYSFDIHENAEFSKRLTSVLNSISYSKTQLKFLTKQLELCRNNAIDTWDFQWQYTLFDKGALSINPEVNLIKNIGFSSEATHTKTIDERSNLFTQEIEMPLKYPQRVIQNKTADKVYSIQYLKAERTIDTLKRILRKLKRYVSS